MLMCRSKLRLKKIFQRHVKMFFFVCFWVVFLFILCDLRRFELMRSNTEFWVHRPTEPFARPEKTSRQVCSFYFSVGLLKLPRVFGSEELNFPEGCGHAYDGVTEPVTHGRRPAGHELAENKEWFSSFGSVKNMSFKLQFFRFFIIYRSD